MKKCVSNKNKPHSHECGILGAEVSIIYILIKCFCLFMLLITNLHVKTTE